MAVLKKSTHMSRQALGTQETNQLYYKQNKERCQMMGDYYVDPEQVDKESAFTLIEAVARYMTIEPYPNTDVLCAILGIKKEDKQDDTVRD